MTRPAVSVILNCFNGAETVAQAIDSVREQTFPDWELVFFDNASTDATADIVRRYGDPRIRYFRSPTTLPLGQARTEAFALTRGAFLGTVDADDFWSPEKLALQMGVFAQDDQVGLVHSDCIVLETDGRQHRHFGRWRPPSGWIFRPLLRHYFLFALTVLLRRSSLGPPPWFSPHLDTSHDKDLYLRVAHRFKVGYVPAPLATYRLHATSYSQRHHRLLGQEDAWILQHWLDSDPDFCRNYADEVAAYRAGLAWWKAYSSWQEGDSHAARRELRPYLGRRRRPTVLFGLTFLPATAWPRTRSLYHACWGGFARLAGSVWPTRDTQ